MARARYHLRIPRPLIISINSTATMAPTSNTNPNWPAGKFPVTPDKVLRETSFSWQELALYQRLGEYCSDFLDGITCHFVIHHSCQSFLATFNADHYRENIFSSSRKRVKVCLWMYSYCSQESPSSLLALPKVGRGHQLMLNVGTLNIAKMSWFLSVFDCLIWVLSLRLRQIPSSHYSMPACERHWGLSQCN